MPPPRGPRQARRRRRPREARQLRRWRRPVGPDRACRLLDRGVARRGQPFDCSTVASPHRPTHTRRCRRPSGQASDCSTMPSPRGRRPGRRRRRPAGPAKLDGGVAPRAHPSSTVSSPCGPSPRLLDDGVAPRAQPCSTVASGCGAAATARRWGRSGGPIPTARLGCRPVGPAQARRVWRNRATGVRGIDWSGLFPCSTMAPHWPRHG